MSDYDQKYGVDSKNSAIKSFHKNRRMFVIKDGVLYLGSENVSYTHAEWFEKEGWVTKENDSFMDEVTRGFVDEEGIYFYKGYDFRVDEKIEQEFFKFLPELVSKLRISQKVHVYGGMIRQNKSGKWPARKDYGEVGEVV